MKIPVNVTPYDLTNKEVCHYFHLAWKLIDDGLGDGCLDPNGCELLINKPENEWGIFLPNDNRLLWVQKGIISSQSTPPFIDTLRANCLIYDLTPRLKEGLFDGCF